MVIAVCTWFSFSCSSSVSLFAFSYRRFSSKSLIFCGFVCSWDWCRAEDVLSPASQESSCPLPPARREKIIDPTCAQSSFSSSEFFFFFIRKKKLLLFCWQWRNRTSRTFSGSSRASSSFCRKSSPHWRFSHSTRWPTDLFFFSRYGGCLSSSIVRGGRASE